MPATSAARTARTTRTTRTCIAPDCTRPIGHGAAGQYCPEHHQEIRGIRRLVTSLLKPDRPTRVRVPVCHHDPRGERR